MAYVLRFLHALIKEWHWDLQGKSRSAFKCRRLKAFNHLRGWYMLDGLYESSPRKTEAVDTCLA
jgi:hypothetical protein